jgi:hypothetical protein
MKQFQISLDLVKIKATPSDSFIVKQNDLNTIEIDFTITMNDQPFVLTGTSVRLAIEKPSGMTVVQNCTITNATLGTAKVTLTTQSNDEVGKHKGELYVDIPPDQTYVSGEFSYEVKKSIFSDTTLASSNDWQVFNEILLGYEDRLQGLNFWTGTQTAYDAIATKDPETIYFIS